MKRRAVVPVSCCFALLLVGALQAAEPPAPDHAASSEQITAAMKKGVAWLERDMVAWREKRRCAACHHGPHYLFATSIAAAQGFPVDPALQAELRKWLLESPTARIFPAADSSAASQSDPDARPGLALPVAYLGRALKHLPAEDPERRKAWERALAHYGATQRPDGSWAGSIARPPVFLSPQQATQWTIALLDEAQPREAALRKKGLAWLAAQPADETHQGLIFRLLSETDRNGAAARNLIVRLRALQQPAGGWRQADSLTSDALATGQTLYALARAGVASADPAMQRGIAFLVRTQSADGSWPMVSRPHPETQRPSTNLNPITYAGSAWGVIGIAANARGE